MSDRVVDTRVCTDRLRVEDAHIGLFDTTENRIWIARKRWRGPAPIRLSHARMLVTGSDDGSTADKDRFLCFWYHTPHTSEGYVQGYPIEWDEGHLLVRVDPNWNHVKQELIPSTERARIEKNLDRQFAWGQRIFESYLARKPPFPLSWHLIGPRPVDSMFYVQRVEASGRGKKRR